VTIKQRFRFAIGTTVTVVDDRRLRRRIVERRYMHRPPKNDVYWLDAPVAGLRYFNGDDLRRVKR
jgi:polynucleotide 5'-kinase involved in rRNA processing